MAEREQVARPAVLSPQFDSLEQQHATRTFGMWVFLMTELMLFGGLFTAYTFYRFAYPGAVAEASRHLEVNLGAINTAVLIVSSLMMALAVHSAQMGQRRTLALSLVLTLLLGLAFLGIKGLEYYHHFLDKQVPGIAWDYLGPNSAKAQLFFLLYFVMTGLHALHLIIGCGLVVAMLVQTWIGRISAIYYTPVELAGLYWHFVDIIWIFLFPLLYLIQVYR